MRVDRRTYEELKKEQFFFGLTKNMKNVHVYAFFIISLLYPLDRNGGEL